MATDDTTFSFRFDGRPVSARRGETVAAALTRAGIAELRETKSGGSRGLFCGMGVCQDCLVTVDGAPNRRACATKASAGLEVRRQAAFPDLVGAVAPAVPTALPTETPDVLIVGGGAGGLAAAAETAAAGLDTLVLDERAVGGGQYYKQTAPDLGHGPLDEQQSEGAALIAAAEAAGARFRPGAEIWGAFEGPVIQAAVDGAPLTVRPKAVLVATGAYERPEMVRGWDLPGVMTTGAAQTLWRSYRTLPGKRVAVVGNGPLNLQVAMELHRGGAEIPLVAEAAIAPWRRPADGLAMMAADAGLTLKGVGILGRLIAAGIRPRFGHRVTGIARVDGGLEVVVADAKGRETAALVDAVAMNYGFHPQNEILRLLGAAFTYDPARAQLIPTRDDRMATSVPGLFAVGDCCGMGGAPAAREEGRIAAAAIVADLTGRPFAMPAGARAALAGHRRFQAALWQAFAAPCQGFDDIAAPVPVCRCEEVTAGDLRPNLAEVGTEIGSVKRATRIGMGRCQGRYCAPVVGPHLARLRGRPVDERAFFAPRVPVKPVTVATLMAAEAVMTQEGEEEASALGPVGGIARPTEAVLER